MRFASSSFFYSSLHVVEFILISYFPLSFYYLYCLFIVIFLYFIIFSFPFIIALCSSHIFYYHYITFITVIFIFFRSLHRRVLPVSFIIIIFPFPSLVSRFHVSFVITITAYLFPSSCSSSSPVYPLHLQHLVYFIHSHLHLSLHSYHHHLSLQFLDNRQD